MREGGEGGGGREREERFFRNNLKPPPEVISKFQISLGEHSPTSPLTSQCINLEQHLTFKTFDFTHPNLFFLNETLIHFK